MRALTFVCSRIKEDWSLLSRTVVEKNSIRRKQHSIIFQSFDYCRFSNPKITTHCIASRQDMSSKDARHDTNIPMIGCSDSVTLTESADVGCINTFALISPVTMKCKRSMNTSAHLIVRKGVSTPCFKITTKNLNSDPRILIFLVLGITLLAAHRLSKH